jgi:hypothetical protein
MLVWRLYNRCTFRKDRIVGAKRVSLWEVLSHYNGRLDHLELTLDLLSERSALPSPKVGELITLLHGLNVDMTLFPPTPQHIPTPLGNNTFISNITNPILTNTNQPAICIIQNTSINLIIYK